MVEEAVLKRQLGLTLERTNFPAFGRRYEGKVRDNYFLDGRIVMISSDRLSAFDRVLTTIPFKGQVLNQISVYWFERTKKVFPNHLIESPDPNVIIARKGSIYPIEMVVRGYLTGSAWRDYRAGKDISGIKLPKGLKNWQKFPEPLVTPSTKAEAGLHDVHISKENIIKEGIVSGEIYGQMEEAALKLYAKGTEMCARQGLILVDTKYEFADCSGQLIVADEMHTPDSSRFWFKKSYGERFSNGIEPEILDKEYLRQWLIKEKNFIGEGPIPEIPAEQRIETARRYITAFEKITGRRLEASNGNPLRRIEGNLRKGGYMR